MKDNALERERGQRERKYIERHRETERDRLGQSENREERRSGRGDIGAWKGTGAWEGTN